MIASKDEVEATVTYEDQNMINQFSWLNNRMHDLQDEIKEFEEEIRTLDDAGNDMLISMSDNPVRMLTGEVFVEMGQEEAEERITRDKQTALRKIAEHEDELKSIKAQMAKLKVALYGKFKSSINLEED